MFSTEKKWSVYTSNYLYKEMKKLAIDEEIKDYEAVALALEILLGLSPHLKTLQQEAEKRGISVEELIRNHAQIVIS